LGAGASRRGSSVDGRHSSDHNVADLLWFVATGQPDVGKTTVSNNTSLRTALWDFKTRLQFTGWLQYLPNAVASLVCFVAAAAGWMIGTLPALLFWTPLVAGSSLLVMLLFDVCTVKYGLRPSERLPRRRDDLDAFDLMRARRSCRSFQSRNLPPEALAELKNCVAEWSDPARTLGDRPIRFEYVAAPLTVWPVVGAHEFLVAIAPREYDRLAVIDVGRSLQKVVTQATRMGLATCWIGPGADHASILSQLGPRFDPEADHIICVCAVGYRSLFKPMSIRLIQFIQRRRLHVSSLFFADPDFRIPLDTGTPPFDRFGRCYEVCQWSPSSFNAQPTRCAAVVRGTGAEGRVSRFDFFASTDSRFYAPVALGIWCANWETGCEALGISGRFSVLRPGERGVQGAPQLPRYDVSWLVDDRRVEAPGGRVSGQHGSRNRAI
jgi:nitroreductase